MKNAVLIGMPGSGKSTIGSRAAALLGAAFIDVDDSIVAREGKAILEIFEESGEAGFREIETQMLRDIANAVIRPGGNGLICSTGGGLICSTGGGIVTRPENKALLSRIGNIIFLYRGLDEIAASVSYDANRPLLRNSTALKILWEERRSLYRDWADSEFVNEGGLENAAANLAKIISC